MDQPKYLPWERPYKCSARRVKAVSGCLRCLENTDYLHKLVVFYVAVPFYLARSAVDSDRFLPVSLSLGEPVPYFTGVQLLSPKRSLTLRVLCSDIAPNHVLQET